MDEYFRFLQSNGFNALRIPFSLAFAKSYDTRSNPANINYR
jgi:aryl-phospho-beta-D-glucosidase BglC (GH1 family)